MVTLDHRNPTHPLSPEHLFISNNQYIRGAFVLTLPDGRFAVSDLHRRVWTISNSPDETLDNIRECNKIIHAAEPPRPKPAKLNLEDLGL